MLKIYMVPQFDIEPRPFFEEADIVIAHKGWGSSGLRDSSIWRTTNLFMENYLMDILLIICQQTLHYFFQPVHLLKIVVIVS